MIREACREQSDAVAIRRHVDCITESPEFARSKRLAAFLRWVVEHALAGDTESINESNIGIEVYQRGKDYDPKIDGTVRTEAMRLRNKLREYYGSATCCERIWIPKGGYVPVFSGFGLSDLAQPSTIEVPILQSVPPSSALGLNSWRQVLAAVGALMFVIPLIWLVAGRFHRAPQEPVRIAVLPFLGSGSEQLDTGVTEEIKDELGRIPELRVLAQVPKVPVRSGTPDYRELGRLTGASAILTGEFQVTGGKPIVLRTRLIRTSDASYLWASTSPLGEDAALVRGSIVQGLAKALNIDRTLPQQRPENANARELYLEGRYLWRTRSKAKTDRAIELFRQAITIDPNYAAAYMGLADAYATLAGNSQMDPREAVPLGLMFGRRAVELDPASAEVHAAIGLLHTSDFDWSIAEAEYRKALELNPGYSLAYMRLALNRCVFGDFSTADRLLNKAQSLDPFDLFTRIVHGQVLLAWGHYGEAVKLAEDVLRMEPGFKIIHGNLAEAYFAEGDISRAFREAQICEGQASDEYSLLAYRISELRIYMRVKGRAYAEDQFAKFERASAKREWVDPFVLANGAAALGDREKAIHYLQITQQRHLRSITSAPWDPEFDIIKSDPRFQSILHAIHVK